MMKYKILYQMKKMAIQSLSQKEMVGKGKNNEGDDEVEGDDEEFVSNHIT